MKTSVTLGLVQMSMTENKKANLDKAIRMIGAAAHKGAGIVALPELFATRYFPQDKHCNAVKYAESIPGPTSEALAGAARKNKITLVGGSIYEKTGSKSYNTALVFDEKGRVLSKYRKMHIPHDPSFYEQNYFEKGNLPWRVADTKRAGLGVMICYDQWFPEGARINALMGADILIYPTAIGKIKGSKEPEGSWREAWETVQRSHAIANAVIVSAVNRVGREKDITFWGASFVADQFGAVLARAGSKEEILIARCNLALGKKIRKDWGFFKNRRPETYGKLSDTR